MKPILLVEDDADIRELYSKILRKSGYEVREADNGREALEQLERLPKDPCVVLLDLMMPVMSGPEMLQALQDSHRLASLPVVVLSAGGRETDAPQAQKFIRKPVDPQVLLMVVREYCGRPDLAVDSS